MLAVTACSGPPHIDREEFIAAVTELGYETEVAECVADAAEEDESIDPAAIEVGGADELSALLSHHLADCTSSTE